VKSSQNLCPAVILRIALLAQEVDVDDLSKSLKKIYYNAKAQRIAIIAFNHANFDC
jgi:hypothetical protein